MKLYFFMQRSVTTELLKTVLGEPPVEMGDALTRLALQWPLEGLLYQLALTKMHNRDNLGKEEGGRYVLSAP